MRVVIRSLVLALVIFGAGCASGPRTDRERIKDRIDSRRSDVARCYEQRLRQFPNSPPMKRELEFIVNASGITDSVTVIRREVDDPIFDECLLSVYRGMRFVYRDPPQYGKLVIKYPFSFSGK
jgi:hypothetical protein